MELEVPADEGYLQNPVDSLKQYLESLDHSLTQSICPAVLSPWENLLQIFGCRLGLH